MSVESRTPLRSLRRSKKEADRPDYSEPDFSSWAARLSDYSPTPRAASTELPAAETPLATALAAATPAVFAPAAVVAPVEAPAAVAVATIEPEIEIDDRPSLEATLEQLLRFDGAMCVAVVDSESGMILGQAGSGVQMELAAANASVILRARLASNKAIGSDELIDDLLISLTSQIQIIHPLPRNPTIFTYLIADQAKSSLAMARYKATEADLQIQL